MKALNKYDDVLLTSPQDIKDSTLINENVEDKDLFVAAKKSQDIELQGAIGSRLLWKLQELVYTDNISAEENACYKELLDQYVVPYLNACVSYRIMPIISYKLRNKGVVTTADEHVANAEYSIIKNLTADFKTDSDRYGNLLRRFLCKNRSCFPELSADSDTVVTPDLLKSFSSPIFI